MSDNKGGSLEDADEISSVSLAGACCSRVTNDEDYVTFQYEWPVKVCNRRINQIDEMVLNVSPAFSTALDGVQFTWALRISEDCTVSDYYYEETESNVSVSLYYKDGPKNDVHLAELRIQITDNTGSTKLPVLSFSECEWTRGSGWQAKMSDEEQSELNSFVHANVGNVIRLTADIKMESKVFCPLLYLPNVDNAAELLEEACMKYLEEVQLDHTVVPKLDILLNDTQMDMFEVHELIICHGCDEVHERTGYKWGHKHIENVFTHIYFMQCVLPGVEYFEDIIEVIDASRSHNIAPLTKEIERYICGTIMKSTDDLTFVKKMLLIAEHNELPVLKMMCAGIIADSIVDEAAKERSKMSAISNEMREIASSIPFTEPETALEDVENELLVNSVVRDLKSLALSMRRVSVTKDGDRLIEFTK